jgi:hypothetical protein
MTAQSRTAYRIFISHNQVDNELGHKLADDLKREIGDDAVWYDTRGGLRGGDIWQEIITKELNKCNVFIVLLSPEANRSDWVKREIRMALRRKRLSIIPLICRPCVVPSDLRDYQYISFLYPKSYDLAFQELRAALDLPSSVR